MPLFECSNCHHVENTALSNYWEHARDGKPQLCSLCDPEIKEWHGSFSRQTAAEYRSKFPESYVAAPGAPIFPPLERKAHGKD